MAETSQERTLPTEGNLTDLEQAICDAWREAEADLGITFTTPFVVVINGKGYEYLGLIHGFGRKTGTLICFRSHEPETGHLPDSDNYSVSVLYESYASYDRGLFIDTLNDWQWCGEMPPPSWYTGQPWTT